MEEKLKKKIENKEKRETKETTVDIQKLLENLTDLNSEEIKPKRKNSFNCSDILQYKNKIKHNKLNSKKNPFHLISLLEKNKDENKVRNSSCLKSVNRSETLKKNKNYTKSEIRSNLSSLKNRKFRNFILKSEILVNKKNKSDFKNYTNGGENKSYFFGLLTQRSKEQEVNFNNYDFFKYINNNINNNNINNNDINKKNIISNTYMEIEEDSGDLKGQIRNINENKINDKNKLFNYFGNDINSLINDYYKNKDNSNELKINSNINHNEISKNSINSKDNNNYMMENDIKKIENNIIFDKLQFSNFQNNLEKNIYNQNNINNNMQKENDINNNYNDNNNNSKNMPKNIIFNNYINNTYIFQNQPNYYPNYNNQFYEQNITQYYQNNSNLFSYNNKFNTKKKNNNNLFSYNSEFNQNKKINNNNQYLNIYSLYNQNNMNSIFNNINYKDDNSLAKNATNLSKTQGGSKILQDKISSDEKFTNDVLFPEIKNDLKEICCDIIGNCVIKTLLENLNYKNVEIFLFLIKDCLYEICLTEPGSRSIQKLVEIIYDKPLLLNNFISYLNNNNLGILFKSNYGNHILQKYLSLVKGNEHTYFIYNYIFNYFLDILRDKHGVCVIQKSLSEAEDNIRIKILQNISNNLDIIIKDNYANFILQFVFTKFKRKFDEILPIIIKIEENIVDYCKCKNSSAVIEKCFEKGDQQVSEHLLKYLFENHSNCIKDIIYNPYGFYIIKKSMMINNPNIKLMIMKTIVDKIDEIQGINNGKKIIEIFSCNYLEFNYLLNEKINKNKKY